MTPVAAPATTSARASSNSNFQFLLARRAAALQGATSLYCDFDKLPSEPLLCHRAIRPIPGGRYQLLHRRGRNHQQLSLRLQRLVHRRA